jgi:hypothetical protein
MNSFVTQPITTVPPVPVLVAQCVCCWSLLHPEEPYPASWSSTLCLDHALWTKQQRKARPAQ